MLRVALISSVHIWRGRGFLVPLIAFLCSLGAELIAKSLGGEGYWETHTYPLSMALLVAAGLIWGADLFCGHATG
jgi:hypothetical protein